MVLSVEEIEKRVNDSYELPNKVLEVMPEPLVTVRSSIYQHAPYIRDCIEGVLMQKTTFPVEYIIGEDFSTDGSREIVFEYAKKYPEKIRVITADYNVGAKANGRRCVRASRGKYMAICEGDDYWIDPYKLQKQIEFLENNPEYGLVHTAVKIYSQKRRKFSNEIYGVPENSFMSLLEKNTIMTLTTVFRKELSERYYKEISPVEKEWLMGDYPLWLWFSYNSKIKYLPCCTGVYRKTLGSASRPNKINKKIAFTNSGSEIRRFFLNHYNFNDEIKFEIEKNIIERKIKRSVLINSYEYYKSSIEEKKRRGLKVDFRERIYRFYFSVKLLNYIGTKVLRLWRSYEF